MNDDRNLERRIASTYEESAPSREPRGLLDEILLTTSQSRQRPSWLALIKEPPMRISSNIAVGSPTARVAAIMVATLLIAVMVVGAGIAGSRLLAADGTIVVDPSGNGTTTTITEAVAMAEDGDTILVKPGTYDESITITKDITIRGDGDPDDIVVELSVEIRARAGENTPDLPFAFLLESSDATLESLTVRGESARIIISGGAPTLQGLVLDGIGRVYGLDLGELTVPHGVEIHDGSAATIRDSVLTDAEIKIQTGSSPTILGNKFTIGAIWMHGVGVDPVIRDNWIEGSVKFGILIGGGAKPTVETNTIMAAQDGIVVQDNGSKIPDTGTDPIIRDNFITGATSAGITVQPGASATIDDNQLLDNFVAIAVQSDVVVRGNRIEGGGAGIVVLAGSPSLVDNSVQGASASGIVVGRGTSPILRGNTSCDNGENLKIIDVATPDIDDTNVFCEDAPAE